MRPPESSSTVNCSSSKERWPLVDDLSPCDHHRPRQPRGCPSPATEHAAACPFLSPALPRLSTLPQHLSTSAKRLWTQPGYRSSQRGGRAEKKKPRPLSLLQSEIERAAAATRLSRARIRQPSRRRGSVILAVPAGCSTALPPDQSSSGRAQLKSKVHHKKKKRKRAEKKPSMLARSAISSPILGRFSRIRGPVTAPLTLPCPRPLPLPRPFSFPLFFFPGRYWLSP